LSRPAYVAELYAGADASSLQPLSFSTSRFRGTTTLNKGKWATTAILGPNDPTILPGFVAGQIVTLQVKVWNMDFGTSFENKTGGNYGQSLTFTYKVPNPSDSPPTFYMENLQAFALVPEPSAIALGVIGVAGLFLLRR